MPNAEEIQEQGRAYVNYVDHFISSITRSGDSLPIWNLSGDAYSSPLMVRFTLNNGREVNFDLFYTLTRRNIGEPQFQIYIEAKSSDNLSTVNTGFKEFMKKIFDLRNVLTGRDWSHTHFLFVAPVNPTSCPTPKKLTEITELRELFVEKCNLELNAEDDNFLQSMVSRIHILQLPYENKIIFEGGNINAP